MAETPPKPSILIQLDADPQPSVFDGVVAVDSGVDHLFRHGRVTPGAVRDLVHGALFTRGMADLKRSAIFVGGSDVAAAEALLEAVRASFFGPFRVSALLDANGANTTAAATVLSAIEGSGGSIEGVKVVVLGAGPVGRRIARLLAGQGAEVAVGTPTLDEAQAAVESVQSQTGRALAPFDSASDRARWLEPAAVLISAGPAGVRVLSEADRASMGHLKVAIDLNAVPPSGVDLVQATDRDVARDGVRCWGPLGVGGMKMKIHKAAIRSLFEANDRVLDAEQVFEIGRSLA